MSVRNAMELSSISKRRQFQMEKYSIEENSWLSNMYKIRQHWAKVYLKDTFFAGMTTSGRSDSAQIDDEDGEDKTQQPENVN
ncbi:hypothetical protein RJ639_019929, partial [Escallonia herrerae]